MHEEQTPENQNPQGETGDTGSLDAATAAFAARMEPAAEQSEEQAQTQETEEAEPDPESADEPTEEAEEADPEEGEEAEQLVEVDGKEIPLSELQKGYLRQADYSRKMNEASEKEKAYTERLELIEGIETAADERAEALALVKQIDERIKAYEGVDWAKARAENPAEAALAAVELLQLQDQRKEAVNAAAQVARKLTEGRQKLDGEKRAEMAKVLDKELPGWRENVGIEITKYALSKGYTEKDLGAITDPRVVIALDKARRFDALQQSKEQVKAKAKAAPPVVKPGAPRRVDAAQDAMASLRKSNSLEDAEAAFLARSTRR
jgi:hypothetical protein